MAQDAERDRLLFIADDHFRHRALRRLLVPHTVQFHSLQARDAEIAAAAEIAGGIILTADRWFHDQLRQGDYFDARRRRTRATIYQRAGVAVIAGEWAIASRQIETWLPLIETVARIQAGLQRRVVIRIGDRQSIQIDL